MYYTISYELDGENRSYFDFFSSLKEAAVKGDRLVRKLGRKVGKVLDIQEARLDRAYFYGDSSWYSSYATMSTADNTSDDDTIDLRTYYDYYNNLTWDASSANITSLNTANSANSISIDYETIRNATLAYYTEQSLSSQVMDTIANAVDDVLINSLRNQVGGTND